MVYFDVATTYSANLSTRLAARVGDEKYVIGKNPFSTNHNNQAWCLGFVLRMLISFANVYFAEDF